MRPFLPIAAEQRGDDGEQSCQYYNGRRVDLCKFRDKPFRWRFALGGIFYHINDPGSGGLCIGVNDPHR